MLIDRYSWRLHAFPLFAAVALTIGLVGWYGFASWSAGAWLGGGSLPGLTLGVVAAAIIAFEMGLWPRKALRRFRLFPTKYWLAAHIWFGMACLPIAVVHSGLQWGGWLSSWLLIALITTVISGLYGLVVQNVLPGWLLRQIPGETIYEQIDHVSEAAACDADQLLSTACGPREAVLTMQIGEAEMTRFRQLMGDQPEAELTRMIVIGAPREAARRGERYQVEPRGIEPSAATEQDDAKSLWNAYDELRPFLVDGVSQVRIFGRQARADAWFRLLRQACSPEAERVIGPLERLAEQRRQFNLQQRLHRWLHAWLPLHIGLSVTLCFLLIAHIYFALRFW